LSCDRYFRSIIITITMLRCSKNLDSIFFIGEINKWEISCCHENREHIFLFLTIYMAAEKVQNDYFSSAIFFRSIEYHHACLIFEFWDFGWIMAVEILGCFHHHHEISDP
jgi:hypothetical protein